MVKAEDALSALAGIPGSDEQYQLWSGSPQCPICDAPLGYWMDPGEDATSPPSSPDGAVRCLRCSWGEYCCEATLTEVASKLDDHIKVELRRSELGE